MAKISANGGVALATVAAKSAGGSPVRFVLRSDGALLYRFTGQHSTGYAIRGKVKDQSKWNAEWLVGFLSRSGFTDVRQVGA